MMISRQSSCFLFRGQHTLSTNILEWSKCDVTPCSLQQMKIFTGSDPILRLQSANFLHRELKIRYARAITDLASLPLDLPRTASIQVCMQKYQDYFNCLHETGSPKTMEEDILFTKTIASFKKDASNMVPLVCAGVQTIRSELEEWEIEQYSPVIDHVLDQFFLGRIGIRMLTGQHVHGQTTEGGRVEAVNVQEIATNATQRALHLCQELYGKVPDVDIRVVGDLSYHFLYVQSHLHHMIFEILKNAIRASIEHKPHRRVESYDPLQSVHTVMNPSSPHLGFVIPATLDHGVAVYENASLTDPYAIPPIKLIISQGDEDLTIKISDEAGGIKRSELNKLWHYTYSTSSEPIPTKVDFRDHFSGGGYGLPLCRLFARYFGGQVTLMSTEGYGTDVYIQVHKLGNYSEVIPGALDISMVHPLAY